MVCSGGIVGDRSGPAGGDWWRISCPRCGDFEVTESVLEDISLDLRRNVKKAAAVSHIIRQMADRGMPRLTAHQLRPIIESAKLPTITEAADNLVLLLGQEIDVEGAFWPANAVSLQSRIGTAGIEGVRMVVNALSADDLLLIRLNPDDRSTQRVLNPSVNMFGLALSFAGWRRFEELKRRVESSRRAFMAMKFGESDLDAMFTNHFVPAVDATGFDLRRVIDGQRAGLIDDAMRVDIRASRFVIADLSHHNNGAYWEAGFAEGLGRPVIYTCRKDVFENPETRPHFDTNHHLTVVWDSADPNPSVQKLKDTIRATLPGEAKLDE